MAEQKAPLARIREVLTCLMAQAEPEADQSEHESLADDLMEKVEDILLILSDDKTFPRFAEELGMPAAPWPDLTWGDLRRMIAGRKRAAEVLGLYVEPRQHDDEKPPYDMRFRAFRHRKWLMNRE